MASNKGSAWDLICIFSTSIAIFVSCFLLGFSFDTLDSDKYALMYNQNLLKLECDQVYGAEVNTDSRRWFTGLGRGFYDYRFPRQIQQIVLSDFGRGADGPSISGRSSDGIRVSIAVSMQYLLPRDPVKLCSLVYTYGTGNYESFFRTYLTDAIEDVVSQYETKHFWEDRAAIGSLLNSTVYNVLNNKGAIVTGFQFLSVDIPNSLQLAIENTTVVAQGIRQAELNKERTLVSAITKKEQAVVSTKITTITALSSANATLIQANAEALALNLTVTADAYGYKEFMNAFPGMTKDQILSLAWIDSVLNTKAGKVYVSAETPTSLNL